MLLHCISCSGSSNPLPETSSEADSKAYGSLSPTRQGAALILAMMDLAHDRLAEILGLKSSWRDVRGEVLAHLESDSLVPPSEYYQLPNGEFQSNPESWKPIRAGCSTIDSYVVDWAINSASIPNTEMALRPGFTRQSPAMDACIQNMADEGVIAPGQVHDSVTMSLFLKPKDAHSARVICDLRPLNSLSTSAAWTGWR
jgi:hypothetical protein